MAIAHIRLPRQLSGISGQLKKRLHFKKMSAILSIVSLHHMNVGFKPLSGETRT